MNMTQLTLLHLDTNKFEGPIPSSISQLQNLEVLNHARNHFSGTAKLDSFLKLKKLEILQ